MTHRIITDEAKGYSHTLEIDHDPDADEITIHCIADEDGQPTRRAPPIGFPAHQAEAVVHAIRRAANTPPRSYHDIANHHADDFSPFSPDTLGALREAYAWIASPQVATRDAVTYRAGAYNQLTDLLRRAIALEEARQSAPRVQRERVPA